MRTRQGYGYWRQSIEKLKEKWTAFTTEIIRTITEEEMKIRREEFESLSLMLQNLGGETHTFTLPRDKLPGTKSRLTPLPETWISSFK